MKAETLKKAILQYAMQGKLVEQDPNDEPAKLLLERIKTEKEQLIKDGKIKKEKPLPPITEDEMPYELPKGWEWVRLGNLCKLSQREKVQNVKLPLLNAKYLRTKLEKQIYTEGVIVRQGDYLILVDGENSGEVFYVFEEGIMGSTFKLLNINKCISLNFILKILQFYQDVFRGSKKGAAIPHLDKTLFKNIVIGLPPLAEQKRIVEKLEQILPLVEEYGKNEEKLSKLNSTLPDKIKQSILRHAVQGKLVPQNLNDEPASELLKRIKAEKEQLIKDGKIKKEKPLPPITEDEIPFQIPNSWEWVRLRDLTEIITKGSSPSWQGVNYTENKEVLFITSENVGKFKLLLNKIKYVEYKFNEIEPRSILEYNDILMNIVGASIGRTAIFNLENTLANINQATCIIRIIKSFKVDTLLKYLLLFFNSSICYMYMNNDQVDSARANLSMTNIANFLIPIPPLDEQQRIVTKVEELLAIVDKLKHKGNYT